MKKSYSFFEGLLSLCSVPRIRKNILPILIFTLIVFFIFSKVKESAVANALLTQDAAAQKEAVVSAAVEKAEGNAVFVAGYIENSSAPDTTVFNLLDHSTNELDQLSRFRNDADMSQAGVNLIDAVQYKNQLLLSALQALRDGKNREATALLHSAEMQSVQNKLKTARTELITVGQAYGGTVLYKEGKKQFYFWSWMVYLSGALLAFILLVYVVIKTRLSSDSERKVKVSSTVKENFLANMSHEIRTPLNAVLGFTNILRNTKLSEEQKEYVEVIQTSGDGLLSIVNDILDLSKIEAGMLRIEKTPFRIGDVVSAVEAMLRPRAEEKKLEFIVNVDCDIPEFVSGDAVRLTQILINLVSNAIKFTDQGGVYLRVSPIRKKDEVVQVEFLVKDTGIGICINKQKKIFDRFEQAEASTTRRFGGTGLGLSIVKNLIELQNGTIELLSREGAGTTFTLEIPYEIADTTHVKTEHKKLTKTPDTMKTDIRILIAEDNVMNQKLIMHLMKSWNFNFDLVFNGAQAVEALKKQSYDLVLMDVQMPEMDGYTATHKIRSELQSGIPIIAMTAHAMQGEKEKCLKAGMNDYLSKPINEEMLFGMIQQYSADKIAIEPQSEQKAGIKTDTAKVIDLSFVDKYSKGNVQFRNELLQEFINTVPGSIYSLETAIGEQNYNRIKEIAHDMKTTVHVVGLTVVIGHLLQQLEHFAFANSDISSIDYVFGGIKDICLQAVQEAGRLVA